MADLLNNLIGFFQQIPTGISYLMLLIYMALESSGIPLPNEVILLFAGFLAHEHIFNIYTLITLSITGSMIGVAGSYYLGYFLGERVFKKFPAPPFLTPEKQHQIDHWLHKKSIGVFVFTRFMPFIRTYISIFAGINKVNPLRLFIESLIGTMIWCSGFLALGFFVGEEWEKILRFFHKYTPLALIIVIFGVSLYIYFHFFYNKDTDDNGESNPPAQP